MRRRPERLIISLVVTSLLLVGVLGMPAAFAQDAPPESTPDTALADVLVTPDAPLPETSPVGEPLTLTFTINHPREAVLLPPDDAGSSRFVIADAALTALTTPENGPHTSSLAMTLLPLRAGTAPLAGLELGVSSPDGKSSAVPLHTESIKFVSTLNGEVSELRPPQPPHVITQEDYTPVKVGAGVLGVALLLALVALGVHALKPLPEPPAPLPIDVVALDALRALEHAPLDGELALVGYYTQMSEVLRDYFGKRYGFPGTEYTTSEILGAIPVLMLPPSLGVSEVAGWLRRSDRVKFSSLRPESEDARADLRHAMAMVELTRPVPDEPDAVTVNTPESPSDSSQEDVPVPIDEDAQETPSRPEVEPVLEDTSEVDSEVDALTDDPVEDEDPEERQEVAQSALGAMSWDELSEMVDELDDEQEDI